LDGARRSAPWPSGMGGRIGRKQRMRGHTQRAQKTILCKCDVGRPRRSKFISGRLACKPCRWSDLPLRSAGFLGRGERGFRGLTRTFAMSVARRSTYVLGGSDKEEVRWRSVAIRKFFVASVTPRAAGCARWCSAWPAVVCALRWVDAPRLRRSSVILCTVWYALELELELELGGSSHAAAIHFSVRRPPIPPSGAAGRPLARAAEGGNERPRALSVAVPACKS